MDVETKRYRGIRQVSESAFRIELNVGITRKRKLVNANTYEEAYSIKKRLRDQVVKEGYNHVLPERELRLPPLGSGYGQTAWKRYVEYLVAQPKSWLYKVFKQAQKNAVPRSLGFDLTFEEFVDLVVLSGGVCSVTGHEFVQVVDMRCRAAPFLPSLDRRDSSQGYTKNNCRLVCLATNMALGDWGLKVFHRLAISYAAKVLNGQYVNLNGAVQQAATVAG